MLWKALMAAGDLRRLQEISAVLIRYGFGDMVHRLGFARFLAKAGKSLGRDMGEPPPALEPPARVRRALEELGPTFIKLGQILATRVDLFPAEWIAEFSKLQDAVPALPFESIREQIAAALGVPPETVFAHIDPAPLAAASLAQVHAATLLDGTRVVLKVRRPGIRPVIEADMRLLDTIARLVASEMPEMRRFHPQEVVRQFTQSLHRELDFVAECRNAERIAANFAEQPEVVIPKVYWDWCSESLNVQANVEGGIPGRDLAAADAAGLDRTVLARRGATAVLKMMLEDGFFHADPHPGNVFYLPENRIAFIDFGMVGRISKERRYQVMQLLLGLSQGGAALVVEVLEQWSGDAEDMESLQGEIESFVDQYRGVSLKHLNLAQMLGDLVALLREHGLTLPPDLTLLLKAFITLEGLGRQLDPNFDMAAEARPFLVRMAKQRYMPGEMAGRGVRSLLQAVSLVRDLPQDVRRLLKAAQRGRLQIQIDVTRIDAFTRRLDRAASRLTVGLITSALIIGSSIVMTVKGGPLLLGLPFLGVLGFSAALVCGFWLMFSIWRSGRHLD